MKHALASAIALNAEAGAPEWIHLLPAGTITTVDGRGPYRLTDAARVVAISMQAAGGKLPIDENHSIDVAARRGEPSPARGWIVEMQSRADGIWGKVDWNESGKALLADRAYRGISPVIAHPSESDFTVRAILRASLVNNPNLRGLAALHAEGATMEELMQKLRKLLGIKEDADFGDVYDAMRAVMDAATAERAKKSSEATALQSIAAAAGLATDAAPDDIVGKVTALAATQSAEPGAATVIALQAELNTLATAHSELQKSIKLDRATAFVDGEIKNQRVGLKPMRDHYIARHASGDAVNVEKEIRAMATLNGGALPLVPLVPDKDGKIALNADQKKIADMIGVPHDDYAKTLAADAAQKEEA